jgi:hypothetical protein
MTDQNSTDPDARLAFEPLVRDFDLVEVQLPYDKWDLLQRERRPSLSDEARAWLDRWNAWDFACSPMEDEDRRLIRLGHYLGWSHSADR